MLRLKKETGLEKIRSAIAQAQSARTPRQRKRAIAALTEARAEVERSKEDAPNIELEALVAGKQNWSDARVRLVEVQLNEAQDSLTEGAS